MAVRAAHSGVRRAILGFIAVGLGLVGCGSDEPAAVARDSVGAVDVDCTPDALNGGDDEFVFTTAYAVVDSDLGEPCWGEAEPLLVDAWNALVEITPPGQLGDIAIFGGFEADGGEADDTLAFVNALDTDGSQFQMSVNLAEATADEDELLLTLAHEFTHVFTATSVEAARGDEALDGCDTYSDGEVCYLAGSLIASWIDEFWFAERDGEVGPIEGSQDAADTRCAIDDGFFGPYAATSPEEDFAEAFSAFVFGLEADTASQQARLDWIAERPGLDEFRARADEAGLTPLANTFEICG